MSKTSFMKTALFVSVVLGLSLVVFPVAAQLNPINNCNNVGLPCGQSQNSAGVVQALSFIVNAFLGLVGLLAAIYIIIGGVKYIMSQGDENTASEAKKTILYAVVGLCVVGIAAVLVNFVVNIFT